MPEYHGWTHRPKEQGGTDPIPGGQGREQHHAAIFYEELELVGSNFAAPDWGNEGTGYAVGSDSSVIYAQDPGQPTFVATGCFTVGVQHVFSWDGGSPPTTDYIRWKSRMLLSAGTPSNRDWIIGSDSLNSSGPEMHWDVNPLSMEDPFFVMWQATLGVFVASGPIYVGFQIEQGLSTSETFRIGTVVTVTSDGDGRIAPPYDGDAVGWYLDGT